MTKWELEASRQLYEDQICRIWLLWIGIVGQYKIDMFPKPKDQQWIKMQIEILAKRIYGKEWVWGLKGNLLNDGRSFVVRPAPDLTIKKKNKRPHIENIRRNIDD